MCSCGCNTCESIRGPLLTEGKVKVKSLLSENLQYHVNKNIPLFESVFRIGSNAHLKLIKEARKMYSRDIINLCEEDEHLIKTHLGEFGIYEGEAVPLDLPMLNEKGADTAWEDEEGNKVTLQDILDMTKNVPQKDYPTEKLAKVVLNWDDNPEEVERIEQVEISKQYPILIMVDEAGKIQWILDGNHRAQKALRSKAETIPAKLIKPSMLNAKSKRVLLGVVDENVLNEFSLPKFDVIKPIIDKFLGGVKKAGEKLLKIVKREGKQTLVLIKEIAEYVVSGEKPTPAEQKKITEQLKDLGFLAFLGIAGNIPFSLFSIIYFIIDESGIAKEFLKLNENKLNEAEYKGREVKLNKPKRGGPKKFYVYVRDPKTKRIKKVTFGAAGGGQSLKVKLRDKKARNAFSKRHRCPEKKDRTKASYWSCNLPRYASMLGLGANMNTFW